MFTPEDCYYHLYLHLYLSLHQVNTGLEVVSCKNIGINIGEFGSKYRANIYIGHTTKIIGKIQDLLCIYNIWVDTGLQVVFQHCFPHKILNHPNF